MKNDWKDKMLEKVFDWQGDGVIYYEEAISICEQEIDRAKGEGRKEGIGIVCSAIHGEDFSIKEDITIKIDPKVVEPVDKDLEKERLALMEKMKIDSKIN